MGCFHNGSMNRKNVLKNSNLRFSSRDKQLICTVEKEMTNNENIRHRSQILRIFYENDSRGGWNKRGGWDFF